MSESKQIEVLRLLEEGKITVDEAEIMLRAAADEEQSAAPDTGKRLTKLEKAVTELAALVRSLSESIDEIDDIRCEMDDLRDEYESNMEELTAISISFGSGGVRFGFNHNNSQPRPKTPEASKRGEKYGLPYFSFQKIRARRVFSARVTDRKKRTSDRDVPRGRPCKARGRPRAAAGAARVRRTVTENPFVIRNTPATVMNNVNRKYHARYPRQRLFAASGQLNERLSR